MIINSKLIKNNVSISYGINLQKIILNSPTTILPMLLAGEFSQKIEAVFAGFEGVLISLDYVKSKCYGSNTSAASTQVVSSK